MSYQGMQKHHQAKARRSKEETRNDILTFQYSLRQRKSLSRGSGKCKGQNNYVNSYEYLFIIMNLWKFSPLALIFYGADTPMERK